jgi:hypothetical protein
MPETLFESIKKFWMNVWIVLTFKCFTIGRGQNCKLIFIQFSGSLQFIFPPDTFKVLTADVNSRQSLALLLFLYLLKCKKASTKCVGVFVICLSFHMPNISFSQCRTTGAPRAHCGPRPLVTRPARLYVHLFKVNYKLILSLLRRIRKAVVILI